MIRVLRDRHARIMCWWGSVSDFFHKKSLEIRVTFSAMYSSPRSLSFAVLIWHSVGKRPWRNQASLNEPTQNILYPIQNSSIRTSRFELAACPSQPIICVRVCFSLEPRRMHVLQTLCMERANSEKRRSSSKKKRFEISSFILEGRVCCVFNV